MRWSPPPRHGLRALSAAACALALLTGAAAEAQPAPPSPAARGQLGYTVWPPRTTWGTPGDQTAPAPDVPAPPPPAPPRQSSAAFDLGVVTELPLLLGGQATLELPYGILLQSEVGVLPPAYVNAIDGALTSAGAYGSTTSDLVRSGLSNSLIVGVSGGWRPFRDHGLELLGGYTLASLGGGLSAKETIEAATGVTLPAAVPDEQIPIHSTIHAVHASIGWRWLLTDHLALRASLGYLQAVASSSQVGLPAGVTSNAMVATQLATVNQVVNSTLNDTYTKYVKLPVLGLSLAYRF
jgi:hypothetical protein